MSLAASIQPIDDPGIRTRWQFLESQSAIRTPFASLEYMEDTAAILGLPLKAAFVEGDGDVAGLLFLERKKAGLRYTSLTGFTPFSAVAATSLPTSAEIHAKASWVDVLARSLTGTPVGSLAKVDLLLPPSMVDIRSFQWADWQAFPLYTFRLDVRDPERSIHHWSDNTRRSFKKARADFEFRESTDAGREIVHLCIQAYQRHNRQPPLAPSQLEKVVLSQIDRSRATCYSVHQDGAAAPSAGVVVLGTPPDGYYWIAGSSPGHAMTVLIGELIFELSIRGFTGFDLVGANTPSIAEFKRKFNPTLTPYYRVRHVRNRSLRIFFSLKEALRF